MTILYPNMLWGLFGIVPLVLLMILQLVRQRRGLTALGTRWAQRPVTAVFFAKWFGQTIFLVIFYAAAILALAEVQWGDEPIEDDRGDLDIVFLVDVSRSMTALDTGQSRLDSAKDYILGLVREFPGARCALVVFKGDAVRMVPLTEDSVSIEYALQYLSPGVISAPGTNIELGLVRALSAFPEGSNRHRTVVLLSDGEELSGSFEGIASRYHRLGIPVLALGFGTLGGTGIPVDGETLLRHPVTGETVVTRLDPSRLSRIAELSAGAYFDTSEPGAFSSVSAWIGSFEETRNTEGFRLVLIPRYSLFLGIALLGLLGVLLLRAIRIRGVV